ncbi:SIALI-17 repeat-containing surface protein, partial [Streptococcus sp. SK643]|uniref:SIALI-17 repeat-containing surface protein n=1 Tax=Streptococcus sp. SK643 TaxID=1095727 RepID=UPI00025B2E9D
GANYVLAASNESPEYKGGVNGTEAAIHEVPEYTAKIDSVKEKQGISGVADAVVHERSDHKEPVPLVSQSVIQDKTYQAPVAREKVLPNTGSKETATLVSVGLMTSFLSVLTLGKKRKD